MAHSTFSFIVILFFLMTFFGTAYFYCRKHRNIIGYIKGLSLAILLSILVFVIGMIAEGIVVPKDENYIAHLKVELNKKEKRLEELEKSLEEKEKTLKEKERRLNAKEKASKASDTVYGKWVINQIGKKYSITIFDAPDSYYAFINYGNSNITYKYLRRSGIYFYVKGSSSGEYYEEQGSKLLIGDKNGILPNTYSEKVI